MNVRLRTKIHNRFDIVKTNVLTGKTEQVAQAENILLNQHWTYFNNQWASSIYLGRGSGTLDPARTALFNPIGSYTRAGNAFSFDQWEDGIISQRCYITLNETQLVGETITEIGVGSSARPHTHALLKDMNGNPVSLTKTNIEILTIYATTYAYLDFDALAATGVRLFRTKGGLSTGDISQLLQWMVGFNQMPTSCYPFVTSGRNPTINNLPNAYFGDVTPVWNASLKKYSTPTIRMPAATNTVNPIRAVGVCNNGSINQNMTNYFIIDLLGYSGFSGSFIEGEPIGIGDGETTDFVTDYGFIKPGSIVYVNGVEMVSGVAVDELMPIFNDMTYFCNLIETTFDKFGLQGYPGTAVPKADNHYFIFENPYYTTIGLDSVYLGYVTLYASDDAETWTLVYDAKNSSGTIDISAFRNKRYWKVTHPSNATSDDYYFRTLTSTDLSSPKNIHFDVAPAQDAVITMDCTTQECVKTSNYVVDASFEILFDEYTGA